MSDELCILLQVWYGGSFIVNLQGRKDFCYFNCNADIKILFLHTIFSKKILPCNKQLPSLGVGFGAKKQLYSSLELIKSKNLTAPNPY